MNKEEIKKEILSLLLSSEDLKTSSDISDVFSELQGMIYQDLLDAEFETFMKDDNTEKNKKNGYTTKEPREIKTKSGVKTNIHMPRDRNGKFEPKIVPKRSRIIEDFSDVAILLYSRGSSLDDIKELLKEVYRVTVSKTYISELISKVSEKVKVWQKRELKPIYSIAYIDCLHCTVKVEGEAKKVAVYVIIGVDLEGKKEILSIEISDGSESSTYWNEVLYDLKNRGVKDILYIAMDGLPGLKESVENIYPFTKTQRCIVHIVRNLYKLCPKKDSKLVISDFKKIYTSASLEEAELHCKTFLEKHTAKKSIIKYVKNNIDHVYGLFYEPKEIRRLIYTTNAVESVNSSLRRVTHGKGMFMNKESLLQVLYLRAEDLEKKWSKGIQGWNKIFNDLINQYGERITQYL